MDGDRDSRALTALPGRAIEAGDSVPFTPYHEPAPPELRTIVLRYVSALLRNKWLIIGLTLAGTAGGMLATRFIEPRYLAQATIWIEASSPGLAGGGPIQQRELLDEASSWVELMRSFVVLDQVVHERRLFVEPANPADSVHFGSVALGERVRPGRYRLQVGANGRSYTLRTRDGDVLESGALDGGVGASLGFDWRPEQLPGGRTIDFAVHSPRDVALRLSRSLTARSTGAKGNFLRVELSDNSPEGVAGTLTVIMRRFVEVAAELKRSKLDELTEILAEQLTYAEANMRAAELAFEGFRVETITLPSEQAAPVAPGLQETRDPYFSYYFTLKIEQEQLRRDQEAIARAISNGSVLVEALEIVPSISQTSAMRGALQELNTKRAEQRALLQRYTEEHQSVRRVQDEIRSLEREAIPALAAQFQAELSTRVAEIERQIASASVELRQIPPRMIEQARLGRHVGIAENLYRTLETRHAEARLAVASSIPDVRVLDEPRTPTRPVKGTTGLHLILIGVLGGMGAGVGLALLRDRLDSKLRYPEQITTDMGLPILAGVPQIGRNGAAKRDPESLHHAIESFRSLRFNVLQAHGVAGPTVIAISSPGSGDGKSFVTSNLGVALADLGRRVLLIDGDIRRGTLHRIFQVVRGPGLTDCLQGDVSLDNCLQATSYPQLQLLSGGKRLAHGPELLSSPAMRQLLVDARQRFDVVIVDSPPLGAGADPYVLSTLAGSLLLVMRTGSTERPLMRAHLEMLERLPIRILGVVLNAVPKSGAYRYYAYSYISGYEAQDELPPARSTDVLAPQS